MFATSRIAFWTVALLALVSMGCGGAKKITVKGKLTSGGQPIKLEHGGAAMLSKILLGFIPIDPSAPGASADTSFAIVKEDGSFTVPGPDNKGLPAGKYKITVQVMDPMPEDKLKNKFTRENSKIVRDIADGADINIDVSKPEG